MTRSSVDLDEHPALALDAREEVGAHRLRSPQPSLRTFSNVGDVERAEHAVDRAVVGTEYVQLPRQRDRVRRLHRAKAPVAAAVVRRAERAAAGVRDRTETGVPCATITQTVAAPLALDADARRRDRRPAAMQKGVEHLEQLPLVDRAAVQLEVDRHVGRDRRRGCKRRDVLRRRVDDPQEIADVGEVAQRLDAAGRGAGADRDQVLRRAPHLPDPLGVVRRRDRALDERQVVGAFDRCARCFEEVRDLDLAGKRKELVLAVEQRELAAVARGELPDCQLRFAAHSSLTAWRGTISSQR